MDLQNQLKSIISLIVPISSSDIDLSTPLLGEYAELDSMGVVRLLVEMESELDLDLSDLEITAEIFETFGSLFDAIQAYLPAKITS
jgi:acyl carrier protein